MNTPPGLLAALDAHGDCAPDLAARLGRFGRMLRARETIVAGHPALLDPAGEPFAVAAGARTILLRTPGGWERVDAWPDDITFRRGDDIALDALRAALDPPRSG